MKRRHRLPFGAEIVAEGVRFRLWAPSAREVACAIGDHAPVAMARTADGWFELTTAAARAGSRYRYVVDGLAVPDPASRYQPEDAHGPSEVIDSAAYEWSDDGWSGRPWEEMVLYELHTGTFSESGDFAGIGRRLDHLVRLGVTAIELMPIADFPGRRNWGYDGVLLYAPDHRYGRPEDLKRLVEACHARGLAILLDVVYNHFGPDGNYLHAYAREFFTSRHRTPWGEAIDFDGPNARPVRDFYVHNTLFWLEEYNFDGLRFDAVHAIKDDSEPDILTEIARAVRARLGERPHLVLENDDNAARYLERRNGKVPLFTAQWADDIHHVLRVAATGTTSGYYADYAERVGERLGRALAEGFAYQGEPSAYRDGAPRGSPSAQLPPTAFVSFIQNHDQVGNNAFGTRLAVEAEPAAMHAVAAILLLAPHIPMLFMGEEWGATQPFCFFCDFAGDLAAAVRDGRRREFAKFAEFQDPAARDRIPDPGADDTFARSVLDWSLLASPHHAVWLERYRSLVDLRRREIVPRLAGIAGHAGRWRPLGDAGPEDPAVQVEWRLGDGTELVLVANFCARSIVGPWTIDPWPAGRLLYASGGNEAAGNIARGAVPPLSATFVIADPHS